MKRAFITGITGQDGSYLAELLLEKGYEVHGLIRRSSSFNTERIDHLMDPKYDYALTLHHGDLSDVGVLTSLLYDLNPDEIYNLGAQSHVRVSFDMPIYTGEITGLGAANIMEAMRHACPQARLYQASSSEMYGRVKETPQTEETPFCPQSPYGCAKVYAYHLAVNYRESYGLHISNGILFNHESPRRGETFVTRKITRAIARIKAGLQKEVVLGNLESKRDWGYAPEYVEGMWRMLQQDEGGDYVLATGHTKQVKDFLMYAFCFVGLDYGDHFNIDPRYYRPSEVNLLLGDASKAKKVLQWEPKVGFNELVEIMVKADMEQLKREQAGDHIRL